MTMSMISGCDDFVRVCAVRFLLSEFFFLSFFFSAIFVSFSTVFAKRYTIFLLNFKCFVFMGFSMKPRGYDMSFYAFL